VLSCIADKCIQLEAESCQLLYYVQFLFIRPILLQETQVENHKTELRELFTQDIFATQMSFLNQRHQSSVK